MGKDQHCVVIHIKWVHQADGETAALVEVQVQDQSASEVSTKKGWIPVYVYHILCTCLYMYIMYCALRDMACACLKQQRDESWHAQGVAPALPLLLQSWPLPSAYRPWREAAAPYCLSLSPCPCPCTQAGAPRPCP